MLVSHDADRLEGYIVRETSSACPGKGNVCYIDDGLRRGLPQGRAGVRLLLRTITIPCIAHSAAGCQGVIKDSLWGSDIQKRVILRGS